MMRGRCWRLISASLLVAILADLRGRYSGLWAEWPARLRRVAGRPRPWNPAPRISKVCVLEAAMSDNTAVPLAKTVAR